MKTALIGFGSMGRNHYRILNSIEGIDLVAVCDPAIGDDLPEQVYYDIDTMLEKIQIDSAVVCVPTNLHRDIAVKLAHRGINLFIEKPVAHTVEEADEIIEAIEAAGVKSAVGHIERFNPVIAALIKELDGKNILSIDIQRVGPFPPRVSDIGILVDLSVHDIDLIRLLTGFSKITSSSIFGSTKVQDNESSGLPDNAVLSFKLENETVASIMTNWLTPFKKRKIEVATNCSYYEADLMTQELTEFSSYKLNNSYVVRNCYVRKSEPLMNELTAFLNYFRTGDRSNLATVEDSRYTLEILAGNNH